VIVDSPIIPDLCRGTDRTIPQDGDAQVLVPPMIQPIIDTMLPHHFTIANNILAERSATGNFQFTRTNLGSLSGVVIMLPPGVFDITCHVAARSNYTGLPSAVPDFRIHFIEGGVSRYDMLLLFATVGMNHIVSSHNRLLSLGNGIVEWFVNTTGVGQTIDVNGSVNVVRIL